MTRRAAIPQAAAVNPLELDLHRGGKMFRDGKPAPKYPGEEAWGHNRQSAEWLGYQ